MAIKMNLPALFTKMPTHVIMRMAPEFPDLQPGSDIDILCKDMDKVIKYLNKHYALKRIDINPRHVQLDYYNPGLLKFDLYSEHISPRFTHDCLRDRQWKQIESGIYQVPYKPHEDMLKCYEWLVNKKQKYAKYGMYEELLNEYYRT